MSVHKQNCIITAVAASNIGYARDVNEDNFFLNGQTLDTNIPGTVSLADISNSGIYAVSDGMGGEENGELASLVAVNALDELYQNMNEQDIAFDKSLNTYVHEANARICTAIEENNGRRIGTTLAIVYIQDGFAYVANIGDSRVYLFRDNRLVQLTEDHTPVRSLVNKGILTEEQARIHPERHMLTQHLGIFPSELLIEPYVAKPLEIQDGDTFILCSDGLTDMVTNDEIAQIITSDFKKTSVKKLKFWDRTYKNKIGNIAEKLVDSALINGGKDNITVLVVKVQIGERKF